MLNKTFTAIASDINEIYRVAREAGKVSIDKLEKLKGHPVYYTKDHWQQSKAKGVIRDFYIEHGQLWARVQKVRHDGQPSRSFIKQNWQQIELVEDTKC